MDSPNTVSTLLRKRSEIAGQIEHTQNVLRQLVIDLDHVDATLRIFSPNIDLENVKPKPMPPKHAAFRGEVNRIILEALRDAKEPLSAKAIAVRLMEGRGLRMDDPSTLRLMSKRVGAALRHYRGKGAVHSTEGADKLKVWSLTR